MYKYHRSFYIIFKQLNWSLFGAFISWAIVKKAEDYFTLDIGNVPALTLGAAAFLFGLYYVIYYNHVRFELEKNGILRHYARWKLQDIYDIKQCAVSWEKKREESDNDLINFIYGFIFFFNHIDLLIFLPGEKWPRKVDCTALGDKRFELMFSLLETLSMNSQIRNMNKGANK